MVGSGNERQSLANPSNNSHQNLMNIPARGRYGGRWRVVRRGGHYCGGRTDYEETKEKRRSGSNWRGEGRDY